jgi:hypothetical protein
METIRIYVANNIATCERGTTIVCDNSDYQIEFVFDEEWSNYPNRTARFIWNKQYYDVEFTGNTCMMPPVCSTEYCTVGVYSDGIQTTTGAKIRCRPSVLDLASEPTDGYNQHHISEALQAAEEAKQAAVDAAASAERIETHITEAVESATNAATSAGEAATFANEAASSADEAATSAAVVKQYQNCVSNALVGSASGEMVVLDDVSPIAHGIAASVRKKNLCNVASITGEENAAGDIKLHDIKKHGTYTASADITLYADDAATNPTFTVQVLYTDYTHSDGGYSSAVPKDGVTRRFTSTVTTDSTKEIKWVRILALNYSTQSGRNAKAENIQLEEGATATPYAPYIADTSGVKVKAYGKNLLDIHNRTKGTTPNDVNTIQRKLETDKYYVGLTANNYCYEHNVTAAEYVDGVWRISNKSGGYGVGFPVEVKPNTSYYLTGVNGYIAVGFYDKDGNFIKHFAYKEDGAASFLTPSNCTIVTVCLVPETRNTIVEYSKVQLEEGTTATEYEPYKEPVTYAQGEPITSIYPCTTLMTDTAGAFMDVTYNRDLNKAFLELQKSILALGV